MARRSDHTREGLVKLALDAARRVTAREGLRGLRARQVARDIGYTIGTLYNMFEDLDDLVLHMNGQTLDALFEVCSSVPVGNGPEEDLTALAERYLDFTRRHPNLWNAIFEHKLPPGRDQPDWYTEKVTRLLLLEERALVPFFPEGREEEIRHHAQVLWTSLFGMAAVESAGRLRAGETANSLVQSLIKIYVAGLGRAERSGAAEVRRL